MKIPKRIDEFSIEGRDLSRNSKAAIRDAFLRSGVPERALVVWEHKKYFRTSAYALSENKQEKIRALLRASRVRGIRIRCWIMKPRDWFYRWQQSYRVMPAGKKFRIIPAWKKISGRRDGRIAIHLDPGSAFGTGGHETTQLMIRLLESLEGKTRSFLDAGTGSGVLSIVAAKLGAGRIVAFDNDAMSVKIAAKNFKLNGGEGGLFLKGDLKQLNLREKFDVVAANLLSKTLLENRSRLVKHLAPQGHLVLSGVAKRHFPDFQKKFRGARLKFIKELYGRSWASAIYKKRPG